jgi:hypothetical protein
MLYDVKMPVKGCKAVKHFSPPVFASAYAMDDSSIAATDLRLSHLSMWNDISNAERADVAPFAVCVS